MPTFRATLPAERTGYAFDERGEHRCLPADNIRMILLRVQLKQPESLTARPRDTRKRTGILAAIRTFRPTSAPMGDRVPWKLRPVPYIGPVPAIVNRLAKTCTVGIFVSFLTAVSSEALKAIGKEIRA